MDVTMSRILSLVKAYPYKQRLLLAGGMLCCLALINRRHWPPTQPIGIAIAAAVLASLCSPAGRLFWFFLGVGAGALLLAELAHLVL